MPVMHCRGTAASAGLALPPQPGALVRAALHCRCDRFAAVTPHSARLHGPASHCQCKKLAAIMRGVEHDSAPRSSSSHSARTDLTPKQGSESIPQIAPSRRTGLGLRRARARIGHTHCRCRSSRPRGLHSAATASHCRASHACPLRTRA